MPNKIQSREYSKDGVMDGVSLENSLGFRRAFNVNRNLDGKRWLNANDNDPDNVWNPDNHFVWVRRNSLHFSPGFCSGEFFFARLPLQPPKFRPISFSFSESRIYFLSSNDFVSQRIFRNIFKTSDLRMASLTYGIFSSGGRYAAIVTDSIISVKYLSTFCPSVYL